MKSKKLKKNIRNLVSDKLQRGQRRALVVKEAVRGTLVHITRKIKTNFNVLGFALKIKSTRHNLLDV